MVLTTNLPGVFSGLPRTPNGCKEAFRRYEAANSDIPQPTRRLLALAAVGPRFGRKNVEAVIGSPAPRFPFRDFAWRWWNVLQLSGLANEWDTFKSQATTIGIRRACQALRKRIPTKSYLLFLKRFGGNPHNSGRLPLRTVLWTKGGCWRIESPFTKILVLRVHLPERPLVQWWQKRLGHEGVKLIERELMRLIDPDKMLVTEAKLLAMDYTANRIQELLLRKRKPGPEMLAWFFQWPMADKNGYIIEPQHPGYYFRKRRYKRPHLYEW